MSARTAQRFNVPRIGSARPSRRSGRSGLRFVRAFAGEAPIRLSSPIAGLFVVATFLLSYLFVLAFVGPAVLILLAVPAFAAAVVLPGSLAAVAWAIAVAASAPFVGPSDPVAIVSPLGEALLIVAAAAGLRAVVVLAIATRTETLHDEARLAQQRAAQLGVLQAASGRLSRASSVEAVGRAIVEETRRIIDYHNARVYVIEPGGNVVPIAFEGMVGE